MPSRSRNTVFSRRQNAFVPKKTREGVNYDLYATEEWALIIAFFRYYPDIMEDFCESENCEFHNSLINRVMKRAMARNERTFTYATRGLGKTTCVVSDRCNKGILWPSEITGYYAPSESQAAPLASKAFATYKRNTPLLSDHWKVNSEAMESFKLSTINGSQFTMKLPRGVDTSSLVAEECGQEDRNPFDWEDFNQIVMPTNRKEYKICGASDPNAVSLQVHYITSASRKDNPAFAVCTQIRTDMKKGEKAFAMWVPWEVAVICRMKPYAYYRNLKRQLTAEQFMRECEARCTGSVENPVIKDSTVEAARNVMCAELKHCGNPEAFYVLGYDVSSRDHAGNAMTALDVIKCERQYDTSKWDHYRKSLVYVADSRPPSSAREHALLIKRRWRDYCLQNGNVIAYVIVDARSYGQSVVERLHEDLHDGNPPFRTINDDETYAELVQPDSIPCLYAIMATGNMGQDPNGDMMDYVEREMENGNLRLLTSNIHEGISTHKLQNSINDDLRDSEIQIPYLKTRELCKQIANLKKIKSSTGWVEKQISSSIPKDMWSAFLYANRLVYRLEKDELRRLNRVHRSKWEKEARKPTHQMPDYNIKTRSVKRMGRLGIKNEYTSKQTVGIPHEHGKSQKSK